MTIGGRSDDVPTAPSGFGCPHCQGPITPETPPARPIVTCPACGHAMFAEFLTERASLGRWRDWANERLSWLDDRIEAGDLPSPTPAGTPTPGGAQPSARPDSVSPTSSRHATGGAGALLFAAGGLLLVLAGIAFVAFAWDLLGPLGQVAILYVIGSACLAVTVPLSCRLPGTATTVGIVGALVVSTAAIATRVLGDDVIGKRPSLVVAVAALLALTATGVLLRPRGPVVGEVAASLGAGIAMIMVAFAPVDRAVPIDDPWSWWAALTFGIGSLALLVAAPRCAIRTWPTLGAATLGAAALSLAEFAGAVLHPATDRQVLLVSSAVFLGCALAVLGLYVVLRRDRNPLVGLGIALVTASFLAAAASATEPSQRPLTALMLCAIGLTLIAACPAMTELGAPILDGHELLSLRTTVLIGSAVIGTAVGVLVSPWVDWPEDVYSAGSAAVWVDQAWPLWRGVVAGLAFAAVLTISGLLADRSSSFRSLRQSWAWGILPLAATGAALGAWLWAASNDPSSGRYLLPPLAWHDVVSVVQQRVAVAVIITGLAVVALAVTRRLPLWTVWLGAAGLEISVLLILGPVDLPETFAPEIYSLLLVVPPALAGVVWWWSKRPDVSSTWITIAPALTIALLPPLFAVIDDATSQWWFGQDPSAAYQVRVVALVMVAAALTVVGARQRLAGVFFPGLLAVLAIVVIELIELGRFLPQWVSFAIAGALLVTAGARWEAARRLGGKGSAWVRSLR